MKHKRKLLSYILTFILIMTSLSTNLLACPTPQLTTNKFIGDGFEVTFKATDHYKGHFAGDIILKNTGKETIENWSLGFEFTSSITKLVGADIISCEDDMYLIKNSILNADIRPGKQVVIPFTANCRETFSFPSYYELCSSRQMVDESDFKIDFKRIREWKNTFKGELLITNQSTMPMEDWKLEFDFDSDIRIMCPAKLTQLKDNHYIIDNAGYNATIAPGKTIRLLLAGTSAMQNEPKDYQMSKIIVTPPKKDKTEPIITFNKDELVEYTDEKGILIGYIADQKINSIEGFIEDDSPIQSIHYTIKCGNLELISADLEPKTDWKIDNIPLLVGTNQLIIQAKDKYNNIGKTTINILNTCNDNMENVTLDSNDDDKDGLLNYQEDYYGTDKTKPDTDGDLLTDLQEVTITMTNPIKIDSDDNGVNDAEEDFDKDTIINLKEIKLSGNPYSEDTDFDELMDNEEITYGTKLDESDTDEDGLNDSEEIRLGTDPLTPDTNKDGIKDGEEIFSVSETISLEQADPNVTPTLDINMEGELIKTLHINKLPEDDLYLPKEMPGYIGAGYEFELGGTFESAVLTYTFNPELLNTPEFNPAIYYCDAENQQMILLDNQTVDLTNCTVSAPISHFSKYILLDKTQFDKVWKVEIKSPEEQENLNSPLDIVLVIDSSGSMSSSDPNQVRLQVAKEFVNKLREKDQVAVVDFDSYSYLRCGLTNDKEVITKAINTIDSYGGTSLNAGISLALQQFNDSSVKMLRETDNLSEEDLLVSDLEKGQENGLIMNEEIRESDFTNRTTESAFRLTTDLSNIPQESSTLLESEPRKSLKYIIMLTDGEGSYNSNLTTQAIQNNVTIYTVGLGSTYLNEPLLTQIATQTGGKYYNARVADDLITEFEKITEDVVDITTDSDNDGLSDYHEINLRLFNGLFITTDPNNPDTDGDGILDGEEVSVVVDEKNNIHHYTMYSNPNNPDTDGDGYIDSKVIATFTTLNDDSDEDGFVDKLDIHPTKWDVSARDLAILSQAIYCDSIKVGDKLDKLSNSVKILADEGFYATASVSELKGWELLEYYSEKNREKDDKTGGFGYGVYKKENNIVVSFRGTVGKMYGEDWINNLVRYPQDRDPGATSAADTICKVIKMYGINHNIYITGHSRGGFLAQRAGVGAVADSLERNIKGLHYFNGMGVIFDRWIRDGSILLPDKEAMEAFDNLSEIKNVVYGHRVKGFPKGDVVSTIGMHVVKQREYEITQVAKDNAADYLLAPHLMCNFTYYLMPYRYKLIN